MAEAARLLKNAFLHEDCKAIRLYIRKGYDCSAVDVLTQPECTLLHLVMGLSCTDCDKNSLAQSLIKSRNQVDARDKEGLTPLMLSPSAALATVLLDHGADINATSDKKLTTGFTCLMHAMAGDSLPVVQLLLSRGVSIETKISGGVTALSLTCDLCEPVFAEALLAAGARIAGQHILRDALLGQHRDPAKQLQLLRVLLQHGAPVDEVDEAGATPLMLCVREGAGCRVAELLLKAGADVNAAQTGGGHVAQRTALHYAAYMTSSDAYDMLELLLAAGASANLQCSQGNLPLHTALRYSDHGTPAVSPRLNIMIIHAQVTTLHTDYLLITCTLCLHYDRCSRR
jgi:ankyrin repeat protein